MLEPQELLASWHAGRGSGAGLASGPMTAGAGASSRCQRSPVPTRHFSPARTVRHSVPKTEE
uniref:Uncharacterized protein n=1 Tax=Chelonoidis abingdonii TaxID=106734 RepID=A0A8C0IY95_CHEAB